MTETLKTAQYNPFNYLQSEEEIKRFFEDAMNDEDPQMFINALSHWVRYHGVSEVAESTGLNRESLYKTISGKTKPTWATVHKLWRMLRQNYAI